MENENISSTGSESNNFHKWGEYLLQLWINKIFIITTIFILTASSIVITLLLPPYYRASSNLVPGFDKSAVSALAGLSGLSSIVGGTFAGSSLEQLFPTIATSETVLSDVIRGRYKTGKFADSVDLIQYWDINEESQTRNFEVAYKKLNDNLDVSIDLRTGIVTISVLMEEPQLAADVVNKVVDRLDQWIRLTRIGAASEERRWIEKRLNEVQFDVNNSENRLKNFQKANRQIESSPDLLLEQQRLVRDLEINSSIFLELKKRQEVAKVEEIKNIPTTTILDRGRPAARKEKPHRTSIVIGTFVSSIILTCIYILFRYRYGKIIRNSIHSTLTFVRSN